MPYACCTSAKASAPAKEAESASGTIPHLQKGIARRRTSWHICEALGPSESCNGQLAVPHCHCNPSVPQACILSFTFHIWEPALQPDRHSECSNERNSRAQQQGTPAGPSCGQRVHAVDSPQGCTGLGYGRRHGASGPASWSTDSSLRSDLWIAASAWLCGAALLGALQAETLLQR